MMVGSAGVLGVGDFGRVFFFFFIKKADQVHKITHFGL